LSGEDGLLWGPNIYPWQWKGVLEDVTKENKNAGRKYGYFLFQVELLFVAALHHGIGITKRCVP
jgi:hypothetical protein